MTELVNIGQDFGDVLRFTLGLRVAPWPLCQKGQEPFRTEQLRMAHDKTSRAFKHEKRDLLKRLQAGCDNSPKGTIDAPILPLVELLNNEDHFVTTSTCSGRISIFARPVIPDYSDELKEETTKTAITDVKPSQHKGHGKGDGGRWLLSSHELVAKGSIQDALKSIDAAVDLPSKESQQVAMDAVSYDAVLKHEPAIMHVRCVNMQCAEWLLKIALSAGFRESGIVPGKTKLMVAIRTTSTCLEVPLTFQGQLLGTGGGEEASTEYYNSLESISNRRFQQNQQRLLRLETKIRESLHNSPPPLEVPGYVHSGSKPKKRNGSATPTKTRLQHRQEKKVGHGHNDHFDKTPQIAGRYSFWGSSIVPMQKDSEKVDFSLLSYGGYGHFGGSDLRARRRGDTAKISLLNVSNPRSSLRPLLHLYYGDGTGFSKKTESMKTHSLHPGPREFSTVATSYQPITKIHNFTRTVTDLSSINVVLFGGRISPTEPLADAWFWEENKNNKFQYTDKNGQGKWHKIQGHTGSAMLLGEWPTPRWGHSLTAISTTRRDRCCFLLLGGRNDRGAINDGDSAFLLIGESMISDPDRAKDNLVTESNSWYWKRVPSNAAFRGFHHSATLVPAFSSSVASPSSTVVVFGGWTINGSCHPCSRLMILDVSEDAVNCRRIIKVVDVCESMKVCGGVNEVRRGGHAAVALDSHLCIFGGAGDGVDDQFVNSNGKPASGSSFLLPFSSMLVPNTDTKDYILMERIVWDRKEHVQKAKGEQIHESGTDNILIGQHQSSLSHWSDCFCHGFAFRIPNIEDKHVSLLYDICIVGGGLPCFAFGPVFVPPMLVRLRCSTNTAGSPMLAQHTAESILLETHHNTDNENVDLSASVSRAARPDTYGTVRGQESNITSIKDSNSVECLFVLPKSAKMVKVALEEAGFLDKMYRMAKVKESVGNLSGSEFPKQDVLAIPLTTNGAATVDNLLQELSEMSIDSEGKIEAQAIENSNKDKSNLLVALVEAIKTFVEASGSNATTRKNISQRFTLPRQVCKLPLSKVKLAGQRTGLENTVVELLWKFYLKSSNGGATRMIDRESLLEAVRASSLFHLSLSKPRGPKNAKSLSLEKVGSDALLLSESTLCPIELCAPPFNLLLAEENQESISDLNYCRGVQELWAILAGQFSCRIVCRAARIDAGPKRESRVRILFAKHAAVKKGGQQERNLQQNTPKMGKSITSALDADGRSLSAGPYSMGWITVKENGISYSFDITRVMFCSGNVTERTRMASPPIRDIDTESSEVIVDLYAGIGYYTIPFLRYHTRTTHVHCCEWNKDSLVALRFNLEANGVDPARYTIHAGDNRATMGVSVPSNAQDIVGGSGLGQGSSTQSYENTDLSGDALDDKIIDDLRKGQSPLHGVADRVNLGLIPSSKQGWPLAVAALKPSGGWVHVHDNVKDTDIEVWAEALCSRFSALGEMIWRDMSRFEGGIVVKKSNIAWGGWTVQCKHIERVKSYAPHVVHVVADLWIEETQLAQN